MECRKRSGSARCLPLAERGLPLGRGRRGFVAGGVLASGTCCWSPCMSLPVAMAFFAAAALLIVFCPALLVPCGRPMTQSNGRSW